MKDLVFLAMIFCHIVDDYYLQGWLASAKQKEWWEKNAPQKLYKHDYIVALFMHSFSWSFMISVPLFLYSILVAGARNEDISYISFLMVLNLICHMIVDNMKCNQKTINLIIDQSIHILQIICTFRCCYYLFIK